MGEERVAARWRRALFVLWVSARTEQADMRGRSSLINVSVVQPLVFLLITAGVRAPDPARATWLVSAVVLTSLWGSTVWMAGGVLRRERSAGTLARCVTGLHPAQWVLLGKCLGATAFSLVAITASTAVAALLLRIPVEVAEPGWVAVGVLVVALSATALGMLLSCLFLVTRHGLAWSSALMYPVFLLGGLLIPRDVLPDWLAWLSRLVSLHWAQDFLTSAAAGAARFSSLGAALLLTCGYFAVAWWSLRRSVDHARGRGSLDLT